MCLLDKPDGGKDGNHELETMLGNLQTDMNRQGITTVPKGHCSACAKPIVGEVTKYMLLLGRNTV